MLALSLSSVPCISLPGLSSCDTTGNIYSLCHVMTAMELDRRIANKNTDEAKKAEEIDQCIDFYDRLIDTISYEGVKRNIEIEAFELLRSENNNTFLSKYSEDLDTIMKNRVLWGDNGVKIDVEPKTKIKLESIKANEYGGNIYVRQPSVCVFPKIVTFEELSKTHYTLIIPIMTGRTEYLYNRQRSYDFIIAISKSTFNVELYFRKYNQYVDFALELYLFIKFMLDMIDNIKSTPLVLIDHLKNNLGFKNSLISTEFSYEIAQDICKLHLCAYLANEISIAKKQIEASGGVKSESNIWYGPVSSALIMLASLVSDEKLDYLINRKDGDLAMSEMPVSETLSLQSFFRSFHTTTKTHSIVLKMLLTRHTGITIESIGASYLLDDKEIKNLEKKVNELAEYKNFAGVVAYYENILYRVAKAMKYQKVYCGEKILDIPIKGGYKNKNNIFKIPLQLEELKDSENSVDTQLITTEIKKIKRKNNTKGIKQTHKK